MAPTKKDSDNQDHAGLFKKISVQDTEWPAAPHVFSKLYSSSFTTNSEANLIWSDCQWTDNKPDNSVIENMKLNQSINYFPGASEIFRKDRLGENILKMEEKYPGKFKNIIPESWSLPKEYLKFKRDTFTISSAKNKNQYYIVKPNDEQRGCGIYITENPDRDLSETSDCVVSRYIGNPILIEGYKTDLRIHVLIASLDPLTVYIHREGFVRLATVKYEKPNLKNSENLYMHLTNWSLNKNNNEGPFEESGNDFSAKESQGKLLRSLNHFEEYLDMTVGIENETRRNIETGINKIIFKTILASYNDLKKEYEKSFGEISDNGCANCNHAKQAFQLLGYDIMLDESYKPWFIEINHNPDLDDEPVIAAKNSRKLIADTIEIIGNMNSGNECTHISNQSKYEEDEYTDVYKLPNLLEKMDFEKFLIELESTER